MGMGGNVVCVKDRTAHCACPTCNFLKGGGRIEVTERKKTASVRVGLTRRQFQLIYEILDAYEVECARKRLKKAPAGHEYMGLQLLEFDTAEIVNKLREALGQ